MRLSDLNRRTKGLDINVGAGDVIHIEYLVHYLNEATVARIAEINAQDEGSRLKYAVNLLCLLIASWDLTDDDGNTVPLEADALAEAGLTIDVAAVLLNQIMDDMTVGETKSPS